MTDWPVKAKLEPGLNIATFCRHLSRWVEERRTSRSTKHFSEATDPIALPKMPAEFDDYMYFDKKEGRMEPVHSQGQTGMEGAYYIDWMRPTFRRLVSIITCQPFHHPKKTRLCLRKGNQTVKAEYLCTIKSLRSQNSQRYLNVSCRRTSLQQPTTEMPSVYHRFVLSDLLAYRGSAAT